MIRVLCSCILCRYVFVSFDCHGNWVLPVVGYILNIPYAIYNLMHTLLEEPCERYCNTIDRYLPISPQISRRAAQ